MREIVSVSIFMMERPCERENEEGGTGGMCASLVFCGPSVCDCQGLKMDRNRSITLHWNAWRQTRSHTSSLFLCSSSFSPLRVSRQPKQKSLSHFHFRLVIFAACFSLLLLCDVTPVVCQTEGRRCFFFPDSSSLAFIFISFFKRKPTHSVLRHSFSQHRMAV